MAIVFSGVTKHGTLQFAPGVVYSFEDTDAEPYFVACGWASYSEDPATVVITLGEVDIDPETRHNESGLLVQDMITEMQGG